MHNSKLKKSHCVLKQRKHFYALKTKMQIIKLECQLPATLNIKYLNTDTVATLRKPSSSFLNISYIRFGI